MTVSVIAHGGSSRDHPGNSWPAFEAAEADGADCIECDIQMTGDDHLIVRHDLTLEGQRISELALDRLRSVEPALVLFDDLVAWSREQGMGLLAELKDRRSIDGVLRLAPRHDFRHVMFGSYNGPALAGLKQTGNGLVTSLMLGTVMGPDEMAYLAGRYRCDGVHPCWENRDPYPHVLLGGQAVDAVRSQGLKVTIWHEEREDELNRLVDLEPDGICTDTPKVLRRILDRRSRAVDETA